VSFGIDAQFRADEDVGVTRGRIVGIVPFRVDEDVGVPRGRIVGVVPFRVDEDRGDPRGRIVVMVPIRVGEKVGVPRGRKNRYMISCWAGEIFSVPRVGVLTFFLGAPTSSSASSWLTPARESVHPLCWFLLPDWHPK